MSNLEFTLSVIIILLFISFVFSCLFYLLGELLCKVFLYFRQKYKDNKNYQKYRQEVNQKFKLEMQRLREEKTQKWR